MYTLRKRLKDACIAHWLGKDYPKACKHVHGHNYSFEIEVKGEQLNQYDMLIDFGDIKKVCDDWIQINWDHHLLVSQHQYDNTPFLKESMFDLYKMPGDVNTTAENMSKFLCELFTSELVKLNPSITRVSVSVWETSDSVAQFTIARGPSIIATIPFRM